MNEKLKSTLHKAWTEPRHFFLWLALLSICGFVAAAGSSVLIGPRLLPAFVALGCILGFALSIPAFILAWIPPLRRLFSWLLRRRFLVLACLVTLVALFYAVEDWRGRTAWRTYKLAWEAKGERFDLAGLAPPPVPKDQNFFETPLWEDLHSAATNRPEAWKYPEREERVAFSIYAPGNENAPSAGRWTKAERVDLAAWQGYYRGNSNEVSAADQAMRPSAPSQAAQDAFQKRYGVKPAPSTNYFPVAKRPQTPAADVLLALSKFDENRRLLIAAAARPQARFWINYDNGFAMLLPHLPPLKATSQYLALHSTAALKAGDLETALEDVRLSFRLLETIRREPSLLPHLVRVAMLQVGLQPIWEGLADRQWTDADLSVIENELGKLDFLSDYGVAMRGERACGVWGVDYYQKAGLNSLDEPEASSKRSSSFDVDEFLGLAIFQLIPAGWFDQNKLSLCRMHEKYLVPLVQTQGERLVRPATVRKVNSVLETQGLRPYDMFSKMLLPALTGFAEKCARAQTSVDLARVACALERYRLANGQFPETLEALAPKLIDKVPHDVINGQPLKYRRTDDGQFVLYSVGWNETDDGGTVGLKEYGRPDDNAGDWVWRYPTR